MSSTRRVATTKMKSAVSIACAILSLPWIVHGQETPNIPDSTLVAGTDNETYIDIINFYNTTEEHDFNQTDDFFNDFPGDNETTVVTEEPSQAPVALPTNTPSVTQIIPVEVPVVGQVPLKLINTRERLTGDTLAIFLSATLRFLKESVDRETLKIEEAVLLRQFQQSASNNRRALQTESVDSPLYVVIQVVGKSIVSSNEEPVDLDDVLNGIFESARDDYISTLKNEDEESFFENLVAIEITTIEEDTTPFPIPEPTPNPTVASILPPTSTSSPVALINSVELEENPTSLGVIVGIAVAGLIIVILLFLITRRLLKQKEISGGEKPDGSYPSSPGGAYPTPPPNRWTRNSRAYHQSLQTGSGSMSMTENDQVSSKSIPLQRQVSDLESQTMYSYSKNDSDSLMGGSPTYNNSIGQADTMSYAYSLEPGLDPSVAGSSHTRDVAKEVPQITVSQRSKAHSVDGTLSSTETGTEAFVKGDADLYGSPSDIELTDTELAMLPSNLRASSDASDTKEPTVTRKVLAPPGKLGLVIDTTVEGPVIHRVNDTSALKNKVFPGNIIIGIDNVDTRAMSAGAITNLMVKTANKNRVLTIQEKGRARK